MSGAQLTSRQCESSRKKWWLRSTASNIGVFVIATTCLLALIILPLILLLTLVRPVASKLFNVR